MLVTWLVLMVTTRGKPLFLQQRLGHGGRPFTMYKFRTMKLDAPARQHEVANEHQGPIFKNRRDPRITRVGRILRKLSIDEMPQLFNVLAGQMSLVGPRPPLAKEVAQYRALATPPSGREARPHLSLAGERPFRIAFDDWAKMDLWYIAHQNLVTDLVLLAKTPWTVLTARGAY